MSGRHLQLSKCLSVLYVLSIPYTELCKTHFYFVFMYMSVLSAYLCTLCILVHEEARRGIRFPRTGVTDVCQPPCEFKESNSKLLQGQPVLLSAEHPTSPIMFCFTPEKRVAREVSIISPLCSTEASL